MSSILKALKKIENETLVKGDIRSNLHRSHSTASMKVRSPSDPPSKRRVLIIFFSIILLVGSGLILIFKPWEKPSASTITTDKDAEITPLSPIETKTSAITQKATPPIIASEKYDPTNNTARDPALAAKKIEKEEPTLLEKTATGPEKPSEVSEKKSVSLQQNNTSPSTDENVQKPYRMEDNAQFASIPIKSSSESMLELQAIAWSGHPKKRMVVINGHIFHEGDAVEKATVKHIGKNEVVFIKEGEAWRQLFRSAARF